LGSFWPYPSQGDIEARIQSITHSTFREGDVGVYVEYNSTNGTISETLFDDNSKGLSYYFSSKPTIDECVITGNTHGIYLDYYSAPSIVHCINSATYDGDITGNGAGITCTNSSSPYVGSCNISSNGTGVGVFEDSAPDLDGYGANKFMSNTSYHIANVVFGTTVQATGSYCRFVREWSNADERAFVLGTVSENNDTAFELGSVNGWPNGTKARLTIKYIDRDGTSVTADVE
jgi:parallel beta-helix repeat protein